MVDLGLTPFCRLENTVGSVISCVIQLLVALFTVPIATYLSSMFYVTAMPTMTNTFLLAVFFLINFIGKYFLLNMVDKWNF